MALAHIRRRIRGKTTPKLCETEGASTDEEEAAAHYNNRGVCGQFVWPCPREYPPCPLERRHRNWLIPADLSKEECGVLFKRVGTNLGHGPILEKIHIFDETHKKWNKTTGVREHHKHVVLKMKALFGHATFQKALARESIYGHFSFNLVGYVAYLRYCLVESSKKLVSDLDRTPWSWPTIDPAALLKFCEQPSPQMNGRNGQSSGRKRHLMTFSEITDAFVDAGVRSEQEAWQLAKARKADGDDILYNTLGAAQSVPSLVTKVALAWEPARISGGTLSIEQEFKLDAFLPLNAVHDAIQSWVYGGWQERSLILCGSPGLGKTEFGCALMYKVAPSGAFHFINKLDRLRDIVFCPGHGLVVDEACFWHKDIDDLKGLLYPKKGADVACRNKDGFIPRGVPRVFSTNWSWDELWPQAVTRRAHAGAIDCRVLWVDITRDIRHPDSLSGASAFAYFM